MIEVTVETVKMETAPEILAAIELATRQALFDAALTAQNNAKSLILTGGRSGRMYGRGKRLKSGKNKGKFARYHQASAPGEPPANDFGFLANNILAEAGEGLTASLVSRAPYSAALEFGTRTNHGPRPFFRVSAKVGADHFKEVIGAYLKAAQK